MDRWRGKIAVVTGASAGIGAATAKLLAENGMIVVGLARRIEKLDQLAASTKGTIHTIQCDLTKDEDILKVFRQVEEKFGGVDLLVNNAGITSISGLVDGSIEDWKRAISTNVLSLSICTREALKTMRKRGDNGHIIHLNSVAGQKILPVEKIGMYTASKHAVTALTQSLKLELQGLNSKIKVTSLSPGAVHTDLAISAIKEMFNIDVQPIEKGTPEGFLSSEDIADVILMIISAKPHIEIQELTLESIVKAV